MKKLLSLGLTSLMVATVLTGCGTDKKEGAGDKIEGEISIAALDGGYGVKGWEAVAKAFTAKTGVKVNLNAKKNISEVIRPNITAGDTPDLIYYSIGQPDGFTETMIKEKAILDISDMGDWKVPGEEGKTVKDKMLTGFDATTKTKPYGDGKTYLAPVFYSPTGLFYNSKLIGEGKKYALPKTWDDMWKLGEQAKKDGISLFTYPTSGYFDGFFYALLGQKAGVDGFQNAMNYKKDSLTSEKATEAFEIMAKIASYVEPSTVANANKDNFAKNQKLVIDDKALFMPNGNWVIGEMEPAAKEKIEKGKFDWGFMVLPKTNEKDGNFAYSFFEQVYIPTKAKNPAAAKAFIAYMYSDEAVKLFAENGNAIMPTKDAASMIKDEKTKMFYNSIGADTTVILDAFNASKKVEGVVITDEVFTKFDSVVNGKLTAKDWQKGAAAASEKLGAAK